MEQYWARHKGKVRWGVRTPIEETGRTYVSESGIFFVWADKVEVQGGCLLFWGSDGQLNGAIAPGLWHAVYQASKDDTPEALETK
jgi:hypothetical protein